MSSKRKIPRSMCRECECPWGYQQRNSCCHRNCRSPKRKKHRISSNVQQGSKFPYCKADIQFESDALEKNYISTTSNSTLFVDKDFKPSLGKESSEVDCELECTPCGIEASDSNTLYQVFNFSLPGDNNSQSEKPLKLYLECDKLPGCSHDRSVSINVRSKKPNHDTLEDISTPYHEQAKQRFGIGSDLNKSSRYSTQEGNSTSVLPLYSKDNLKTRKQYCEPKPREKDFNNDSQTPAQTFIKASLNPSASKITFTVDKQSGLTFSNPYIDKGDTSRIYESFQSSRHGPPNSSAYKAEISPSTDISSLLNNPVSNQYFNRYNSTETRPIGTSYESYQNARGSTRYYESPKSGRTLRSGAPSTSIMTNMDMDTRSRMQSGQTGATSMATVLPPYSTIPSQGYHISDPSLTFSKPGEISTRGSYKDRPISQRRSTGRSTGRSTAQNTARNTARSSPRSHTHRTAHTSYSPGDSLYMNDLGSHQYLSDHLTGSSPLYMSEEFQQCGKGRACSGETLVSNLSLYIPGLFVLGITIGYFICCLGGSIKTDIVNYFSSFCDSVPC